MVQNNVVSEYLQKRGYRFIYSGGWWEPTRVNRNADRNINLYADSNEFTRKFAETTILNPILFHFFGRGDILGFSENRIRNNHTYKFEHLQTVAADPSPKFVFVHMLLPHSPYVFDAQCNPYDAPSADDETKKEYLDQLVCTNTQLKTLIDEILLLSERPPIIILQADEGPFNVEEMNNHGEGVDWTKVSDEAVRWHMGILNAYYLPDANGETTAHEALYDGITPVNTFRTVFNHYFGTNFELLEDKNYFIPHLNYPYQFIDVTDKLER